MSHISFSAFKIWNECPYKHKLMYADKLKGFVGNLYTAFGSAIHAACEEYAKSDFTGNHESILVENFLKEVADLPESVKTEISQKDAEKFLEQGFMN